MSGHIEVEAPNECGVDHQRWVPWRLTDKPTWLGLPKGRQSVRQVLCLSAAQRKLQAGWQENGAALCPPTSPPLCASTRPS